jgi:deferrochelatase/peroxidase EfeB
VRLLRRGYNFVDGSDGLGRLNAGLFFIAYQRDPHRQFVPVQQQLARLDRMNEYIRHVSSGLFAVPPASPRRTTIGAGHFSLDAVCCSRACGMPRLIR